MTVENVVAPCFLHKNIRQQHAAAVRFGPLLRGSRYVPPPPFCSGLYVRRRLQDVSEDLRDRTLGNYGLIAIGL